MISFPLRALCAAVAAALFFGGVAGLVIVSSPWFLAAILGAGVAVMPAMFGGRKPTAMDLPRIDENLHRFRGAMLLCFAGSAFFYGMVITVRVSQPLAALGVAFWLVAFTLMFFVAYYRLQRRMATE